MKNEMKIQELNAKVETENNELKQVLCEELGKMC